MEHFHEKKQFWYELAKRTLVYTTEGSYTGLSTQYWFPKALRPKQGKKLRSLAQLAISDLKVFFSAAISQMDDEKFRAYMTSVSQAGVWVEHGVNSLAFIKVISHLLHPSQFCAH